MGLLDFLLENRITKSPSDTSSQVGTKKLTYKDILYNETPDYPIEGLTTYNEWDIVARLRELNDNAKFRYEEYRMMNYDSVLQSALELYSDDATQVDSKTTKVVSIASDDQLLADDLNNFLDSLDINNRIWTWAYNLSQFGDHYIRVIKTEDNDILIDDVDNPELIMDLYEYGQRVAYAEEIEWSDLNQYKRETQGYNLDISLRDPDSFIHFRISNTNSFEKVEIPVRLREVLSDSELDDLNFNDIPNTLEVDDKGNVIIPPEYVIRKFTVVRGKSMLEGVRGIYRILSLLEDSLLAAKLARSEFIRVYNVEVGDTTPKMVTKVINDVKNLFDSKAVFDTNSGTYKSNKEFRPVGDPVFNPIRNGKGAIDVTTIGGDFEVSDIVDIEYFRNKLFAGLKIPKAYLGFEEELSTGGFGNDTLTRLDIRYSRSVKRIQNALIQGINELCRLWLKLHNRELEGYAEFKVVLQAPSTAEELGRLNELMEKVNIISGVIDSMSNGFGDHINLPKVYKTLFDAYINYPDLDPIKDELDLASVRANKQFDDEEPDESGDQDLDTDSSTDDYDDSNDNPDNTSDDSTDNNYDLSTDTTDTL